MALFLGEYAIDLFAGQPVKSDDETVLESLTATPTTSTQTFLPSIDIDGWNRVTVNPIPSQYIIPSGSTSITQNGTFDISDYASVNVNVPSSGTPEITITTSGAISQELEPGTVYHFTSNALTSLTITFGGNATDQYHFDFISNTVAINLILPNTVIMPESFGVEVNTKYEIDIINNYGVYAEWVYEVTT